MGFQRVDSPFGRVKGRQPLQGSGQRPGGEKKQRKVQTNQNQGTDSAGGRNRNKTPIAEKRSIAIILRCP